MKWTFKKNSKENAFGINWMSVSAWMEYQDEGDDLEIIIRKKIDWNVEQMRKYFEGPCVDFVKGMMANDGNAYSKPEVREWLKRKFVGLDANGFLISTTTLPRDKFHSLLNDINNFCMDKWGCGLPSPDRVDNEA